MRKAHLAGLMFCAVAILCIDASGQRGGQPPATAPANALPQSDVVIGSGSFAFTLRQVAFADGNFGLVPNTFGYSSSGTFTVPAGVTSLTVYVLGGGGGGTGDFEAGGGGGGAAQRTFAVSPGDVIPFTVGRGGAGSLKGSPATSTDGTDSFVTIGEVTVRGGGGRRGKSGEGSGMASGGTINVPGAISGGAGGNVNGVCSGGGGGMPVDDGLFKYRMGGLGGCYPAGEGGLGPPQWGSVEIEGAYWANPGGYVSQPGGTGGAYGAGGGAGGNYSGAGGAGSGGYVLFSWKSSTPVYPTGVTGVAVIEGTRTDTLTWIGVAKVTPSETTTAGQVFYAPSFDGRRSFSVNTTGTWRRIVTSIVTDSNYPDDPRMWRFNSNTSDSGETWTNCSPSSVEACLQHAFEVAANQMTGPQIAAVTGEMWAGEGGFTAGKLDFAIGLRSTSTASTPKVDDISVTGVVVPSLK